MKELQSLLKFYIKPLLHHDPLIPPLQSPPLTIDARAGIERELPIARRHLKPVNGANHRTDLENPPLAMSTNLMSEIGSTTLSEAVTGTQNSVIASAVNHDEPHAVTSNNRNPLPQRRPLRPISSKMNILLHKFSSTNLVSKESYVADASSPIDLPQGLKSVLEAVEDMVERHQILSTALRKKWDKEIPLVRGLESIWCEQVEYLLSDRQYFY